jgi:hypothetical protein
MEREGNDDAGSTEWWKEMNTGLREHKAAKTSAAISLLDENKIPFVSHNGNVHLMIDTQTVGRVDFWPGTGRWECTAEKRKGRGVASLLKNLLPVQIAN